MFERFKNWLKTLDRTSGFCKPADRFYVVGDVAPPSLLNRKPGDPGLGAMISVDPETNIIKGIFIP